MRKIFIMSLNAKKLTLIFIVIASKINQEELIWVINKMKKFECLSKYQ